MSSPISRRKALQISATAGAAALIADRGVAQPASTTLRPTVQPVPEEAKQLTCYVYGGQALFRWNNQVVAAYRANPEQKYPYFSDLMGPLSGLPLTTESSLPYPHHRGLWLGCDPLMGGDYWKDGSLNEGRVRSEGIEQCGASALAAEIADCCVWSRPNKPTLLKDERTIRFQVISDTVRIIDFDIRLTAQQDIQIGRAKHSLFAIRVAPDLATDGGGTLMNSHGDVGEDATFGKSANWCGYFGRRQSRPDVVEGLAVMDHPENPWAPCPWFTRDYGHLSPSPFNFVTEPWKLPEGDSIRLRYRVVAHADSPDAAGLNSHFNQWLSGGA